MTTTTIASAIQFAQRCGFDPIPVEQWSAHLPAAVSRALADVEVVVFSCPDEYSDTAAFSERFGLGLQDCANTLILKFTKEQVEHFAAVVSLGSLRLDVNGAVKERLGAKRLSFAKREAATAITGMEFGGITAFGLPAGMRVLVDAAVCDRQFVVMGAGLRETKILLSPSSLARLADVEVATLTLPAVSA